MTSFFVLDPWSAKNLAKSAKDETRTLGIDLGAVELSEQDLHRHLALAKAAVAFLGCNSLTGRSRGRDLAALALQWSRPCSTEDRVRRFPFPTLSTSVPANLKPWRQRESNTTPEVQLYECRLALVQGYGYPESVSLGKGAQPHRFGQELELKASSWSFGNSNRPFKAPPISLRVRPRLHRAMLCHKCTERGGQGKKPWKP